MRSAYTSPVTDTTIRVSTEARDRLAILARERGTTVRDLVAELAASRLTRAELDVRYTEAELYIKANLCSHLDDERASAQAFWGELAAGRVPESI
jgi:hypothetical protein